MSRKEFHELISLKEAKEKYFKKINFDNIETEEVFLKDALSRVMVNKFIAKIDVPPFDRSSKDGYAISANDTFYADEDTPVTIKLNKEKIPAGHHPKDEIRNGIASEISTGAMIPRGANAVVMVEDTNVSYGELKIYSPVTPGENIMNAGSDMMQGELLINENTILTSRETAVLAAQGIDKIKVYKKPKVAVISTGDEIIIPGGKIMPGQIYDINSRIICDFCKENGCEPIYLGIVNDNIDEIRKIVKKSLESDIIIMSGGTSAGTGDICYRVLEEMGEMVVHGVAVKPGKPIALGIIKKKPVIILPGFPTSSAIMFTLFAKPIIRKMAGLVAHEDYNKIKAECPARINSEKGKDEFVLVNLIKQGDKKSYSAYPITKGSGSITSYTTADGFIDIPNNVEAIDKNKSVDVNIFSTNLKLADINFIGSHCVMLEPLINLLRKTGFFSKVIHVGSTLGIDACKREESDIAGIHLLDNKSNKYNIPFVKGNKNLIVVKGYIREQGILFRKDLSKYKELKDFLFDKNLRMINRNQGAGTRVLFDILIDEIAVNMNPEKLKGEIKGYEVESKTHNGVAAAIALKKADWGIGIKNVAKSYNLNFIELRDENYDFCIPKSKINKKSVKEFLRILKSKKFHSILLKSDGIKIPKNIGEIIWQG